MKKDSREYSLKRDLKTRHLSMIALGGSIGTGLFVASGSAISTAGPGGGLIAYIAAGGNGNVHAGFRIVCHVYQKVC